MPLCSVENCNKDKRARGFCSMHYARLMRRGSVDIVLPHHVGSIKYKSLRECLYSGISESDIGKCWIWQKSIKKANYGNLWWDGKHYISHRASWIVHFGSIPIGLNVCHKCDNPQCVNPSHLFLGSYLVNNRDRKNKCRNANTHGERNPFAKLTEAQVIDILKRLRNREKGRHIAKLYKVTEHTISSIKRGKNWSYLKERENAID